MLYAEYDSEGKIIAIRNIPAFPEQKPATETEIISFFSETDEVGSYATLMNLLDTRVIRVLDDLIDVLITRNVIQHKDLPEEAQTKIEERKRIRNKLKKLGDLSLD